MRGFTRFRVASRSPSGRPGYWFFVEAPVALTAMQLHAIKLGQLRTFKDMHRALMPGQRKEALKEMIEVLELPRTKVHCRVVGAKGDSKGDVVLFDAPNPNPLIFSIPGI
jgi:hypothetical protein